MCCREGIHLQGYSYTKITQVPSVSCQKCIKVQTLALGKHLESS